VKKPVIEKHFTRIPASGKYRDLIYAASLQRCAQDADRICIRTDGKRLTIEMWEDTPSGEQKLVVLANREDDGFFTLDSEVV
jgi:hypothetical protein